MHDVHLGCEARQEERLFKSGVTATNHHNLLPLEEESVAGCTGADAASAKAGLRL